MSFYLQDSSLVTWLVNVNNNGQLLTSVSAGPISSIVLKSTGANYFTLGVSTVGLLTTTSTAAASPANITLPGANGLTWQLGVNDVGELLTTLMLLVETTPGVVADDYYWLGGDQY